MHPRAASAALVLCALVLPRAPGDDEKPSIDPPAEVSDSRHHSIDSAVERGLRYLADHQLPCGAWAGDVGHKQEDSYLMFESQKAQEAENRGHMGVTALAGLAILASGNVPGRGRYGKVLDRAIDYVVAHADEYGYLSDSDTRMYSHAFATLFLAEVEGMTKSRKHAVHETLHRAAQFIADTQNSYGAWRYSPFTTEADLSVTVCQVQALRSARDVGAHVPISVIQRVLAYVKASRIDDGYDTGGFYYKIYGTAAKSKTSYSINAAAATSLLCAGVYDESQFGGAVKSLEEGYDELSHDYPNHFYFWYGNYYATQALHQIGGKRFQHFFDKISGDLLKRQEEDGRWSNDVGPGDNFATAVACVILRVPDEYLPMLQR